MKSILPKILPDDEHEVVESEKEAMASAAGEPGITSQDNDEMISSRAQAGVQKMEATTTVWSKNHLIAAYVLYVNSQSFVSLNVTI